MSFHISNGELYKPYHLTQIYTDALYGQLDTSEALESYLSDTYRINHETNFLIIGIYLGKTYEEDYLRVKEGLELFGTAHKIVNNTVFCLPMHKLILTIIPSRDDRNKYNYLQKKVQNEWTLFAPECSIFIGERCTGLQEMSCTLSLILSQLDWNLVFGPRTLINSEKIKTLNIKPISYPSDIDGALEKVLLQRNISDFKDIFERLRSICRQEIHSPAAIKSLCVRFAIVIAHISRLYSNKFNELELEKITKTIVNAIYWSEIWDTTIAFAIHMLKESEEEESQSLLVLEAKKLMQRYYTTGITLEEIAEKLHVTEEYLSALFKKETGATFSETIRGYRMEKVKTLLKSSNLRILEIAMASGYSDGKYMSRVFKEEVGMSPNEYRKARAD